LEETTFFWVLYLTVKLRGSCWFFLGNKEFYHSTSLHIIDCVLCETLLQWSCLKSVQLHMRHVQKVKIHPM
jgi:hypothetical protein